MSEDISTDDLRKALDRIARTQDGILLYRHLQKIRLGLAPPASTGRALRHFEGYRNCAADLMAHMAEGIGNGSGAVVTFSIARGAPVSASRGAGRRVTADTIVPGWNDGDTGTFAGPGSRTNISGTG
jgi:hypothetical protein